MARNARPDVGKEALEDYLFPVAVFLLAIVAWEAVVRFNEIPRYVLPAPSAIAVTLVDDWGPLSRSWMVTLSTTFEALIAAVLGGVALALSFRLWRPLERAFFPFAVVLQVTPVIAIAPLLLETAHAARPPAFSGLAVSAALQRALPRSSWAV